MTLSRTRRHYPTVDEVSRYDFERMQDNLTAVLDELAEKPHHDSFLLEGISLTGAVENWIEHGLERKVRGWWVVDNDTATHVWRVASSTADLEKYLPLGCSYDCTVSVVVF